MTRRSPLQILIAREMAAQEALTKASLANGAAKRATLAWGQAQILRALERQGIAPGCNVILEGQWSGNGWGVVRGVKHDRAPVRLIALRCTERPVPTGAVTAWWFRVLIARLKKDGTPRDEIRDVAIHGATPQLAAREIEAAS